MGFGGFFCDVVFGFSEYFYEKEENNLRFKGEGGRGFFFILKKGVLDIVILKSCFGITL